MEVPAGRYSRIGLVILSLILISPARAAAQDTGAKQNQQSPQQNKNPPPPLFPKHRRGIYKNREGLEVIDATPQSPPLEVDDPGVPDRGEYEINISTHADFSREQREIDFLFVDVNYGTLPRIGGHELPTQVKIEFPLAGTKEASNA